MCGIAGIITKDAPAAESALAKMGDTQRHRGPDDAGRVVLPFGRASLGLGHRRLAILDLSPAGHQPMVCPTTGNVIVFNGEIYNYLRLRRELADMGQRFAGSSDTEVLLHALGRWGPECLARLEGMFALAFYDARAGRLILARDPMGIKPLYVAAGREQFAFASEIGALLAAGLTDRQIDPVGLESFLAYGSVQEPATFFKDVKAFPPGCRQEFTAQGDSWRAQPPVKHWFFPRRDDRAGGGDLPEAIRSTLDQAVADHLVSDVPVGVFLSAGLDSSTIAALAKKHSPDLRAYTVGFSGRRGKSESGPAAQTAMSLGMRHELIELSAEQALADCGCWLEHIDQPSIDGLNTYIISKAVRSAGIVVALSGLGGDELFGGYSTFFRAPLIARAGEIAGELGRPAAKAFIAMLSAVMPQYRRHKFLDTPLSGGLMAAYLHCRRVFSEDSLARLGLKGSACADGRRHLPREAETSIEIDPADGVWTVSMLESRLYMRNTLLRDADANGMAHGLEIRVPMLDRRMLDLMLPLPGRTRLPNGRPNKFLLRSAMADLLDRRLLGRPKTGFALPIDAWMRTSMRPLCRDAITSLKSSGLLDPRGIEAIWREFIDNPANTRWCEPLGLVVLGLYLDKIRAIRLL
ncbi:MAG: asparagine synthase (glutamine-hydrolyzing) [Planctomycetes bacterium]|nr:asparagine synthase (glutamine-hydrolyzing) [Planctomycetota bacterium]